MTFLLRFFARFVCLAMLAAVMRGGEGKQVSPPLERSRIVWRYSGSFDGFEIYSAFPDDVTRDFIESLSRSFALVGIPGKFWPKTDVPVQVLLGGELLDESLAPETGFAPLYRFVHDESLISISADAWESDLFSVRFRIGRGWSVTNRVRVMTGVFALPGYFLSHHLPALPAWVVRSGSEEQSSPEREKALERDRGPALVRDFTVELPSREGVFFAIKDAGRHPEKLVPMTTLLNDALPAAGTEARSRWLAQQNLLLDWACFSEDGRNRAAFWTFVGFANDAPVTESMIQKAFGLDGTQLNRKLAAHLDRGVYRQSLGVSELGSTPALTFRDASAAEIAGFEGEWARAEAAFLRERKPDQSRLLQNYARRQLEKAVAEGEPSPNLLGALGLCYLESGETEQAVNFLKQAAAKKTARARVYLELERLQRTSVKSGEPLSRKQTVEWLGLLFMARARTPLTPDVYVELMNVLEASGESPDQDLFKILTEAGRFFPRDSLLVERVAKLGRRCGYAEMTNALLDRCLPLAADPEQRGRLQELRSASLH